jgi:putative SOS response-associated peptidase YedK
MVMMCGRFTVTVSYDELKHYVQDTFGINDLPDTFGLPLYNVAPGEQMIALVHDGKSVRIGPLSWGYRMPSVTDPKTGIRPINARGETLMDKPMFREAAQTRRCAIIADGFYEWKKTPSGKEPHRFVLKDRNLFLMAGLWSVARNLDGTRSSTGLIVTTTANKMMAPIHDRMPVILKAEDVMTWLKADSARDDVMDVLSPFPDAMMDVYKVSPRVSNARFKESSCVDPL